MNCLRKMFSKPHGQMSEAFITSVFLTLSGGFQDAYTYFCRDEVFANGQTGNVVLMSGNIFAGNWMVALRYLLPIIAFALGIYVSNLISGWFKELKALHWRQLIVLLEISLLIAVGFMPQSLNVPANIIISFVCAVQVQSFRMLRGNAYATTMCIGNLKSAVNMLYAYFHKHDREALFKSFQYFAVIVLFALGAGAGKILTEIVGEKAIWASSALLSISFLIMFIKEDVMGAEEPFIDN